MRKMKHILFLVLAAFALASCTQDELAEQGAALPEGAYPINIASVQVAEALPQTRVTETSDGMGSAWSGYDEWINIKVTGGGNDNATNCLLNPETGTIMVTMNPMFWNTTNSSSINAWYSNLDGQSTGTMKNTVTLANQTTDNGLAYVLKADEKIANYQTENITLTFRHQLAKIRVKLDGAKADEVTSVSVKSRTSCTVAEGNVTAGTDEGYIAMRQATYNGQTYWEVNVVPGVEIKDFRLNGNVDCQLTQTVTPQAGHVHEVNINVKPKFSIVDSNGNPVDAGNINTDVTITGASDQPITITGTCNVTLKDVSLSVGSGNAISITSGSPTIQVEGDNTITTAGSGAGIYVEGNSAVTIMGDSRDNDKLTVTGAYGSCGIGGYEIISSGRHYYVNCGDITIRQVTLSASSSDGRDMVHPGIGAAGDALCGTITIDDAIVYAYGGSSKYQDAPGIGAGVPYATSTSAIPTVVIKNNSIVHAYRGGTGQYKTDYIGWPGDIHEMYSANNTCNFGTGGSCTSSTVYCYTGDTLDKTVVYDENGEGKEQ